ncbi:hypothetical protein GOP47_0019421 [Adiantum capillus-veneris]|uniref:Uncharacterized protein n=1 Tax=Adiantum capillus-veneris TaxID=13818 RepID=A0A9D4UCS8_ADICA|nr:hypothetical protein GOP47_0019421 [Adiantum capillus-veneris]
MDSFILNLDDTRLEFRKTTRRTMDYRKLYEEMAICRICQQPKPETVIQQPSLLWFLGVCLGLEETSNESREFPFKYKTGDRIVNIISYKETYGVPFK